MDPTTLVMEVAARWTCQCRTSLEMREAGASRSAQILDASVAGLQPAHESVTAIANMRVGTDLLLLITLRSIRRSHVMRTACQR